MFSDYLVEIKSNPWLRRLANPYAVTLLISVAIGVSFILTTPIMWGQDEGTHFARAYQISQGHLFARNLDSGTKKVRYGYGGDIPLSAIALIHYRDNDIPVGSNQPPLLRSPATYQQLGRQRLDTPLAPYTFSNTAVYSPVAYLPTALTLRLARALSLSLSHAIYLARLSDLVFYISALLFVLYVLRESPLKWLFFAAALVPTALYQASIISADPIVNALALILGALIVKGWLLHERLNRLELAALTAATVLLPLAKITYLFLSLLVVLIPESSLPIKRATIFKYLTLALSIGAGVVWTLAVTGAGNTLGVLAGPAGRSFNEGQQIHHLLHSPFSFFAALFRTMMLQDNSLWGYLVGQMSAALVAVPGLSMVLSAAALAFSTLCLPVKTKVRPVAIFGALIWLGLGAIAIFGTLYLTFTTVGASVIGGVQGRYFEPYLALSLVFIALLYSHFQPTTKKSQQATGTAPVVIIVALTAASLILAVIKFNYLLQG